MHQALTQLPLPRATRHQSILYLAHIGKIFYCLLVETLKNQPDDHSQAVYSDLSEAFHQSLFDLKILTHALLEGQFVPAARVLELAATASTPQENDILLFALKNPHEMYPNIERDACHTLAQWLFNEHGPYLQAEDFNLGYIQTYCVCNSQVNRLWGNLYLTYLETILTKKKTFCPF